MDLKDLIKHLSYKKNRVEFFDLLKFVGFGRSHKLLT